MGKEFKLISTSGGFMKHNGGILFRTISKNEYLECRVYSMLLDAILRFQPIHEIFRLLDIHSINYSKFSMALYNSIDLADVNIKNAIENFKNDLLDEMHDSELEVIKYMQKNEENYKLGLKGGGNLRYSNMMWIVCVLCNI